MDRLAEAVRERERSELKNVKRVVVREAPMDGAQLHATVTKPLEKIDPSFVRFDGTLLFMLFGWSEVKEGQEARWLCCLLTAGSASIHLGVPII